MYPFENILVGVYRTNDIIKELPFFVKELPQLKQLFLANKELDIPYENVAEILDLVDFKETIDLKKISELFAELEKKQQAERTDLERKFNERQEPWNIIYPPQEVLSSFDIKSLKFEFIVLWMLNNNFSCEWVDFKNEPLNIKPATLSKYLHILQEHNYIHKVYKGSYMITELGKKRLSEIEIKKNKF